MKEEKKSQTREARRYASMVRQIMKVRGYSLRATAVLLGISQPHLTRLLKETREGIGAELIRFAQERVGVEPDYFYDDYEGERDYRSYIHPFMKLEVKRSPKESLEQFLMRQVEILEALVTWVNRDNTRILAIKEAGKTNKTARQQYKRLATPERAELYKDIFDSVKEGKVVFDALALAKPSADGASSKPLSKKDAEQYINSIRNYSQKLASLLERFRDLSSTADLVESHSIPFAENTAKTHIKKKKGK